MGVQSGVQFGSVQFSNHIEQNSKAKGMQSF